MKNLALAIEIQHSMLILTSVLNFGSAESLKYMADIANKSVNVIDSDDGKRAMYAIADACTETMAKRE